MDSLIPNEIIENEQKFREYISKTNDMISLYTV